MGGNTVQAVDRALKIIEILKKHEEGVGITELSYKLDVSKSTIHRLMMSLLKENYVMKDTVFNKYKLGFKFLELADIVNEQIDIRKISAKYLVELSNLTEETVHLVIRDNYEVVYIDKVESEKTIRMYSRIGKRAPMYCTGVGKVFLSYLEKEESREIIENISMKKFTANTIQNKKELYNEIDKVRNLGYAVDNEEHELGIKCIAAPILDYSNKIIAAVSVSIPTMRLTDKKFNQAIDDLLVISQKISKMLEVNR